MKRYFEIPQVCIEALDPANSIMDEPLVSMNLAKINAVDYSNKLTDDTSKDYSIWKGFNH
ncbi:MAG: hypothetical protein J1F63_00780 [Oscillospiraceae bacterium]|nr:hypothetical protein [Oscillospiraceae bacterium]